MGDRAGCNTMNTQFLSLVITGSKYIIDREGVRNRKAIAYPSYRASRGYLELLPVNLPLRNRLSAAPVKL